MRVLYLRVKGCYFKEIESGEKPEEYRLCTPYWTKRIAGREYDRVEVIWGYPKAGEPGRTLTRPWRGYVVRTLTHPHFGARPVTVFGVRVNETEFLD